MIRLEDRGIVVAVATQIFCARVAANGAKFGYSPDLQMCVGEAAALVRQVDTHVPPRDRPPPMQERRSRQRAPAIELTFRRES